MSAVRVMSILRPGGEKAILRKAAEVIRRGGIVAHPTETVYGLAVDPWNDRAVERLIRLKGREGKEGLILIVASEEQARTLIASPPPEPLEILAAAFWPGPLTLILPPGPRAPRAVLGPSGGIAVRCTSDSVARDLLKVIGHPLTSTSANLSGSPPATTAEEVVVIGPGIDLVIDAGPRASARPSSIVDLRGETPSVIREGMIERGRIEGALRGASPRGPGSAPSSC